MNAVEGIEAAIERLEHLKVQSTPAPWHYWTDELTGDVDLWHDQEVRSHIAVMGHFGSSRVYRDADLIVTLHRTIDAQLAILRANRADAEYGREPSILAFALADAILGGDPDE
jgi:hypothetical protein